MDDRPEERFEFVCPLCRRSLVWETPWKACCPADGRIYTQESGIWRFLLPERLEYYQKFIEEYEDVRRSEGRGMDDPRFYNELPFRDASGRFSADWRIRARSFVALEKRLLAPLEMKMNRPLHILDLGAGNGWLSNRLAQRGHHVAAVDLLTNRYDGLGAWIHYQTRFTPIQAEFEHLPLPDSHLDLAIFNASFHYARDYLIVVKEALRVLAPQGRMVVLDTPVYRDPDSGRRMVQEREAFYIRQYGFPSNSLSSQNFLTYQQLDRLANSLGMKWEIYQPYYGPAWAVRRLRARLLGKREPARFLLIDGRRAEAVHIAKSLLIEYEHDS